MTSGTARLTAFGPAGTPVRLEAATNLDSGAVWLSITTNTPTANQFDFIVTDPAIYPQRFYRVVSP
jgi:hypothetical protein